ncbi:PucR family transcriptional regulator [Brevibacillus borstelensis]|uniref:PucR family transcriptional regulator n=1 Tax=Brevibacillus borstelensis TaxID=45462 RepID=UPI0030C403A1
MRALSRMVGKPLLLIDWLEQRLYPPLPKLEEICSWDELTIMMGSKRRPAWVTVHDKEQDGDVHVCMYPLVNGSVFLGCLVLRSDRRSFSDLERITIEQGISILALDLVKKHSLSSVFYKRSHDFFQHLLTSKGTELAEQAQAFGLSPDATYICVHAMLLRCQDLTKQEANVHRIVTRWKQLYADLEVLTYGFHNQLTMLIDLPRQTHPRTCMERLHHFIEEWNRLEDSQLSAGIGGVYNGFEQIAKSFEEAKKAVLYLRNRNRFGVVHYGDLGVNQLLVHQSSEDQEAFVRSVFYPLWEKKEKYSDLEKTLLVYVNSGQSAHLAARQLHIHINTLYQRLRKIEELLGVDFKQPEDMLKIQLACHLQSES